MQQVGICSVASSHQKLNKSDLEFLIVGTIDFIVVLNQNLRNGSAMLIQSLNLHFSQDNFLIVVRNVSKGPLLVSDSYRTSPQIEKLKKKIKIQLDLKLLPQPLI